jgi:hypothetical protein
MLSFFGRRIFIEERTASTYFSSWVPLLDKSKYSRGKLLIEEISDLPILKLDVPQLARIIKHSIDKELSWEDWLQAVSDRITLWNGRPGFLYCTLLPKLMSKPPTTKEEFLDIWQQATIEAVKKVKGYIDNPILNSKVNIAQFYLLTFRTTTEKKF